MNLQLAIFPNSSVSLHGAAAQVHACSAVFNDQRYEPGPHSLFLDVPTLSEAQDLIDVRFPIRAAQAYRMLPNLADLQWVKQLVKVLRTVGLFQGSHAEALNKLATFWGYRSYGALEYDCRGVVETVLERAERLPVLAALVARLLQAQLSSENFNELVLLTVGIPCLEFEFRRYPDKYSPVLRLYANGVAHVHTGEDRAYGYDLKGLGLQAVDYRASMLPQVENLQDFKRIESAQERQLVRLALWTFAPTLADSQYAHVSDQVLEDAISQHLPMSHYVCLKHRANGDVHAELDTVLLGLPAYYDFALGVVSAVPDGQSLFSSEPATALWAEGS